MMIQSGSKQGRQDPLRKDSVDLQPLKANLRFSKAIRVEFMDMSSKNLLSVLAGNAAYHATHKEMRISQILARPMRVLQIDEEGMEFLIRLEDCRQVVHFWAPLLSHPILSEELRYSTCKYSTSHYGPINVLEAMKSWSTWLVLEHYKRQNATVKRIYPSFAQLLEEVAVKADSKKKEEITGPGSDCNIWEPFLASYSPSP